MEHLVPQTRSEKYPLNLENYEEEDIIYCLGNVTLVDGKVNSQISNDIWKRKKVAIRYYGDNCPLNWEETNFFELEDLTPEEILKRSKNLVEEFKEKKMKLFDIPWDKNGKI